MNYRKLSIPGLILFEPTRFKDERGYFSESFRQSIFREAVGFDITFVQDNCSYSKSLGTVRGLHYQTLPHAQGKLVQCSQGAITDVAVDARQGSPYYGQHVSVELSAQNGHHLWLPEGFLHGFVTREDHCVVQYKCTEYYAADCDAGIRWNDPDLAIDWELGDIAPVLSDKDKITQGFGGFNSPFIYRDVA